MDIAHLKLLPNNLIPIIEEHGLAGGWHWSFTSGEQRWSSGFLRLLGLRPDLVTPDYDLFHRLVHPDDRVRLAAPREVMQGLALPQATVRVIRPSGEMRALSLASELRVSPEGRPLAASGVVLDVTDRDRLRRLQAAEERRREMLYPASYTATFFVGSDLVHAFPAEVAQVHGLSREEVEVDPFLMVVPEERNGLRDWGWECYNHQQHFQAITRERLANGEVWRFRIIGVPLWDEAGGYLGRTGVKYPIHDSGAPVHEAGPPEDNRVRRALEQGVRARHLRAARGLLDWSMATLAEAGGLSLSTVRRLEEEAEGQGSRSHHKAVAALRRAGIRFIAMDDGSVAVAKL